LNGCALSSSRTVLLTFRRIDPARAVSPAARAASQHQPERRCRVVRIERQRFLEAFARRIGLAHEQQAGPARVDRLITARPQHRYDHGLRNIVQRTSDVTVARDLGVPRSTARGCAGGNFSAMHGHDHRPFPHAAQPLENTGRPPA
jgi:hypothetical protein